MNLIPLIVNIPKENRTIYSKINKDEIMHVAFDQPITQHGKKYEVYAINGAYRIYLPSYENPMWPDWFNKLQTLTLDARPI